MQPIYSRTERELPYSEIVRLKEADVKTWTDEELVRQKVLLHMAADRLSQIEENGRWRVYSDAIHVIWNEMKARRIV